MHYSRSEESSRDSDAQRSPTSSSRSHGPLSLRSTRDFRTPSEKFRSAVHKAIALNRTYNAFQDAIGHERAGAEPGIDPRGQSSNAQFGGVKQDCVIEVTDYSAVRCSFGRMTNREFVNFLADEGASEREAWGKVRWINVTGLSWDVVKALGIKYDLHPLALEDVFLSRRETRSKADYYPQHLFLQILSHELTVREEAISTESAALGSTLADDEYEMEDMSSSYGSEATSKQGMLLSGKRKTNPLHMIASLKDPVKFMTRRRLKEQALLEVLRRSETQVNVKISPVFVFLMRDGTVISISHTPGLTDPIKERLQESDTGLRMMPDASMLVQSILDLIVDKALEVTEEYQRKIDFFERQTLLQPKMNLARNLHVLTNDLILHQRTLKPLRSLVYALRRYDSEREEGGYMTRRTQIYLADILDHTDYILRSLDTIEDVAENLIDFAFNMKQYEMNNVIRKLTLGTIICNPLIILTTYFGMNFTPMWSVNQNSDLLFWKIALPMMAFLVPLVYYRDLKRMWEEKAAVGHGEMRKPRLHRRRRGFR